MKDPSFAPPTFVATDLAPTMVSGLPDTDFPEFFSVVRAIDEQLANDPGQHEAFRLLLAREANCFSPRLTGRYVGNIAYEIAPFANTVIFDSIEAFASARATQFAWETRDEDALSFRVLVGVHRRLMLNDANAGKVRRATIWIGERESTIDRAAVVLMPPNQIRRRLQNLAAFPDSAPAGHALAVSALLHFQLVSIHPFADGNGRTARALIPATLRYLSLIKQPYLFVSEELLRRRGEYERRLVSGQQDGEYRAWIRFFVEVLVEQARRTSALLKLYSYLRSDLGARLRGTDQTSTVDRLVNEILLCPTMRRSHIQRLLRWSDQRIDAFVQRCQGVYGFEQIVDGPDPAYQFGDIYDVLAL